MAKTRLYLVNPLNAAIDRVTSLMTPAIVKAAISDGWSEEAANELTIEHRPNKVSGGVRVSKFVANVNDEAFHEEYGTQDTSPKGTVRKFMNRTEGWEKMTAKAWEAEAFKKGRK